MSGGNLRRPGPPPPGSTGRPSRSADSPRRIRHGIRLTSDPSVLREQEYARRWLDVAENAIDAAAREEGLEYAVTGQAAHLEIGDGTITAMVQGRSPQPYETKVAVPPLRSEQWSRLISSLAAEAGIVAKLLADQVPPGLLELTERTGLAILPAGGLTVQPSCSCPQATGCKHAAAVIYLVAQRLAEDPLTLFDLRGMPGARLLERLRQVRAIHAYGIASAHSDPLIPESQVPPPPLESSVEDFWRAGPQIASLNRKPPASYAALALLRRLGPSPLPGKFPLVGLLASIYDSVADRALKLRDHAEQIDEDGPDG